MLSYARGFAPCIPRAEPERHGDRGANHAPGGGACLPCCRLTLPLWYPGGGRMNPSGTCSPYPGGEDHLKRRSSSPPVPPLLGWRHCSPEPHLNSHAPSGYRNATPRPSRKGQSPTPGTRLAGSVSAARVQSRGCKGRSPLHEKNLDPPPLPPGRGSGGYPSPSGKGGRKTAKAKNRPATKTIVPPRRAPTVAKQSGKQNRRAPRRALGSPPFPSAARVQSRGCKGRSPLHEKNLGLPLPAGKGVGGMGERT